MKHIFLLLTVVLIACNSQSSKQGNDSAINDSVTIGKTESVEKNGFCDKLVEEILKTSPRYKKITDGLLEAVKRNGGTSVSVVMEKSPDTTDKKSYEYSTNYEMQLTENYPDRQVSIARFVFSPSTKELYEYDIIADSLKSIPFDVKVLDNPKEYCK